MYQLYLSLSLTLCLSKNASVSTESLNLQPFKVSSPWLSVINNDKTAPRRLLNPQGIIAHVVANATGTT